MTRNPRYVLATILVVAAALSAAPPGRVCAQAARPNFLVIVTDDQRYDSMDYMPLTASRIGGQGVTFTNAFVTTPLCNPSRASMLTGQYAHTHGAQRNSSPLLRPTVFDALQSSGYYTGLVGKYLNSWNGAPRPEFDYWVSYDSTTFSDSYTDPTFNVNGVVTPRTGYITNLERDYALQFLDAAAAQSEPFALVFATKAPHGPAIPAPGDETLYPNLEPARPPNFNEADVSDKPAYLQATPPLTSAEIAQIDSFRRRQLQTLHSVDLAIDALLSRLQSQGRLDNTVVVLLTDNSRFQGEHRFAEKSFLYEEAPRTPLLVRYPPLAPQPRVDARFALNIDIAPTLYELAGLAVPADVEGRSLVPLLANTATSWRDDFKVESWSNDDEMPIQLEAVRAEGYVYIENRDDLSELYDLTADPFQLQNQIANPAFAPVLQDMRARLARLRAGEPIDDTSPSIQYDGWTGARDPGASGGAYRTASAAGQEIRYRTTITTTSVAVVTYVGPDQGVAQVKVDGTVRATVDLYSPSPAFEHRVTVDGLFSGLHTVSFAPTGAKNPLSSGTSVRLDAFEAGAARVEESHTGLDFNTWGGTTTGYALQSGHHSTSLAGGFVRFSVVGTGFSWISARGHAAGIAQVVVDGSPTAVDLYTPSDEYRSEISVAGLAPGRHVVEIRPLGTRNPASTSSNVVFDGVVPQHPKGVDAPGLAAADGTFFLRNTASPGAADAAFSYGAGGATPIEGDWDGNGTDTVGLYDPATGAFFLRNSNSSGPADVVFTFGPGGAGLVPLAGDWNGDGVDSVGLYNPATGAFFLRNTNASGPADVVFTFGGGGATPLAGDWNGDGVDSVGLYAPATGSFFLRNANAAGPADLVFTFGAPGLAPLTGDWDGDGTDTVGIYVAATGAWFLRETNAAGAADLAFGYGPPNLAPLSGDWDGR